MSEIPQHNDLFSLNINDNGMAILDIFMHKEPTNLFSIEFIQAYLETASKVLLNNDVNGLIITSSHRDFMAGADLRFIANPPEDKKELFDNLILAHEQFRALEKQVKPIVSVINGTALGGGYELCLTAHYRIALDDPHIKIGLPETKLGLLPGGGGTQRLSYLIGIPKSVTYILKGTEFRPKQALEEGLVNALCATKEKGIQQAEDWILQTKKAVQPWDDRSYRIPGGGLMSKSGFETMVGGIGNLRKKTHGHYPGVTYAMACIHDGMQLPIDRGLEVEARYFIKAFYSKEAQNIIKTVFFGINEANKGKDKTESTKYTVKKLGVLGAGMMGAGIAYVSAKAGMNVILKDIDTERAEKGKAYSSKLLDKKKMKGYITEDEKQSFLSRIIATDQVEAIKGADLIIEAVYENPNLKNKVTKESEPMLSAEKVFASNTSTIPISQLAKSSTRPANFIGIHFFSPVDKMPLVEIIVGKETSPSTINAAIDYVLAIKKTPIVVNDSPGFFTSRVFSTYTREGALMLQEGVDPVVIENVAKNIGMPVGPLAVTDEVSLSLCVDVMESTADLDDPTTQKLYQMYKKISTDLGRHGKRVHKGFYDYGSGKQKQIWKGLYDLYPTSNDTFDIDDISKRFLCIMALESYRCLDEGVLRSEMDGNIGSILGFGFPPYTGGVFSYIDYIGKEVFIETCDRLANQYGDRFSIPASLRD